MSRVDPIFRDIDLLLDELQSPAARSARLADFAAEQIEEAKAINRTATGKEPRFEQIVDGRKGAALSSVKPDGVVVANFDPLRDVLEWIGEQLVLESPRLTGAYSRSHVMEIDGVRWDAIGPMPDGEVYKFFNTQPYARKMEPRKRVISERAFFGDRRKFRKHTKTEQGQSSQAPDGVYEAIAAVARHRFGDVARISYTAQNFDAATGLSYPAIIVSPF